MITLGTGNRDREGAQETKAVPCLLMNGRISTMDAAVPSPEALLTDGERIAFTGTRRDAEAMAATFPRISLVDLQGNCVIPGLIDMHAHLDREGLKKMHPSMTGLRSRQDVLDRVAALVRGVASGEWIVTAPLGEPPFFFFDDPKIEADLYPSRWELDEIAPDNPVYIRPILGFWRWSPWPERLVSAANTAAMRRAGLTDATTPPSPSVELERDSTGHLTGRFFERTTASILELTHFARAFRYSGSDRLSALRVSQRVALSTATTTVFEGHGVEPAVLQAYESLHCEGQMAVRAELVFSPDWSHATQAPEDMIESQFAWLQGPGKGDDVLRMRGIFINPLLTPDDQVRGNCNYTGMAGYHFGSGVAEDSVLSLLKAVARAKICAIGLTPALFSLFDRVADEVDIRPLRWLVQHCGRLSRKHAAIASRCNLGLSFLPVEACYKQAARLRDDKAYAAELMPLRRLLDTGVRTSIASDNIPQSLFFAIWCCLARCDHRGQTTPDPDGPISREEALRIATLEAARCLGRAESLGSLAPGKYADLAVLDRDYFECPLDDVAKITAQATMVGGHWRHGDPMNLSRANEVPVHAC
jgi:predicted amidohydrolase YtcJ